MLKAVSFFLSLVIILCGAYQADASDARIDSLSLTIREEMKAKNVWKKDGPVVLNRLRLATFSYCDFEGPERHEGEMVVLDAVAQHVAAIFRELKDIKFPLSQGRRMEHNEGNDDASMAGNNSSCFNCREISG